MMWANIMSIDMKPRPIRPIKSKHPEAPEPGEELMYVDLTREKLEDLYND